MQCFSPEHVWQYFFSLIMCIITVMYYNTEGNSLDVETYLFRCRLTADKQTNQHFKASQMHKHTFVAAIKTLLSPQQHNT